MADSRSRTGSTYTTPEVLDWLAKHHAPHDPALTAAFTTPERLGIPAIHVQPSEGKLLGMLLRMVGAKKVVEVGTLAGYSAIHMTRALPADGHLYSVEFEPKHADAARENLALAGLTGRATVHVGKALDVLPTLEAYGPFDAVFIDADKHNYDHYGRWAAQHTRRGGLLLGDNALFFGNLLHPTDPGAAAMRRFHEEASKAFDTVCIPTPDGLLLGVKK